MVKIPLYNQMILNASFQRGVMLKSAVSNLAHKIITLYILNPNNTRECVIIVRILNVLFTDDSNNAMYPKMNQKKMVGPKGLEPMTTRL